jgi:hypothetical protein
MAKPADRSIVGDETLRIASAMAILPDPESLLVRRAIGFEELGMVHKLGEKDRGNRGNSKHS